MKGGKTFWFVGLVFLIIGLGVIGYSYKIISSSTVCEYALGNVGSSDNKMTCTSEGSPWFFMGFGYVLLSLGFLYAGSDDDKKVVMQEIPERFR